MIDRGSKAPRYPRWNLISYKLEDVPRSKNIGLMLGPKSGGTLAIDFDGMSSFSWWEKNVPYDLRSLLSSSAVWQGRSGRCQIALRVPETLWDLVPSKFAITTGVGSDGKPEQIEWRWSPGDLGVQSVLPPSIHPDTGEPYQWLNPPSKTGIAIVPDEVLAWAIQYRLPKVEPTVVHYHSGSGSDIDQKQVETILDELVKHYPQLPYDDWFRVACIVANAVGDSVAVNMLQARWPEQIAGEYMRKIKSRDSSRTGTLGSLVFMIRKYNPTWSVNGHLDPVARLKKRLMKHY